jgi:hypothetical protein
LEVQIFEEAEGKTRSSRFGLLATGSSTPDLFHGCPVEKIGIPWRGAKCQLLERNGASGDKDTGDKVRA